MDQPRASIDRFLPLLGVALIVEALLAFSPWISTQGQVEGPVGLAFFYLTSAALPALLGAMTLMGLRRPSTGVRTMRFAYVVVAGLLLISSAWIFTSAYFRALYLCYPISALLAGLGVPALWGSAIVRISDPGNAELQKLGRISAGLVQVGFVFQFFSRLQSWGMMGQQSGIVVLQSLLDVAENVLLLWASVDALRTPKDVGDVHRRAFRIHRLMQCWLVLLLMGTALQGLRLGFLEEQSKVAAAYWVWRGILGITATIATAFLTARRYPAGSYKSESPAHPWGGAEA